jgi:hypothetical protein
MARDMDKAASDDYEEKLLAELEKFKERVFGIGGDDDSDALTWV